jgi:hypothetical protein
VNRYRYAELYRPDPKRPAKVLMIHHGEETVLEPHVARMISADLLRAAEAAEALNLPRKPEEP